MGQHWLTVVCSLSVASAAGAQTPFDKSFDWDDHKRDLTFCVNPAVDACVLGGMSGKDDGGTPDDPTDDVMDPTPADGFTLGDAARVAAMIWNAAGSGWMLTEVAWAPDCAGCDIEIIKEEKRGFEDQDPAPADVLALHIQKDFDDCGHLLKAQICYNDNVPLVKWSINPGDAFAFDPILVMLHEIGHCLRLDHPMPGGVDCVVGPPPVPPVGTSVMCAFFAQGVHRLNPGAFDPWRNPSGGDVAGAVNSAAFKIWKPADFNEDGIVDINDFIAFQGAFVAGNPDADIDGNGVLNILDWIAFATAVKNCL